MRALITGIGGFAGSHLADYLVEHTDWDIWGVVRRTRWRISHLQDKVNLVACDLNDPIATQQMVNQIRPHKVFHLAAQANVGASWYNPWSTYEANLKAQLSLLEALVNTKVQAQVLIVGSNEAYGRPAYLPIDENHPFQPITPYGVSKATQDLMGQQYYLARELPIIRVRPFNHIGPRQSPGFVCPDFASQVARIEAGLQEPVIRVGNLSARRDFTDVRDVAVAYVLAMEAGKPGDVYNVGRGESHPIQEILDILLQASTVPIRVEQDPKRMRPSDVPDVICDAGKLRSQTGWQPVVPFRQSVLDTLEEWRQKIAQEIRK